MAGPTVQRVGWRRLWVSWLCLCCIWQHQRCWGVAKHLRRTLALMLILMLKLMLRLMPRRRLFMNAALVSDNVDGTHNCRCASSSHVACITWSLRERGVRVRGLLARRAGNQLNTTAKAQSPLAKRRPALPLWSLHNHYLFLFLPVSCVCVSVWVCAFWIIAVSMCDHCAGVDSHSQAAH